MPRDAATAFDQGRGEDLDIVLNSASFQPSGAEQEPTMCRHLVTDLMSFPKLAQWFKFKDVYTKASAEPQPPACFRDDRQEEFYNSLVALFYWTRLEILPLISTAQEKEYQVEELSATEIEMLKEAYDDALNEVYDDDDDDDVEEKEEIAEKLREGHWILSELSTVSLPP